MKQLSSRPTGNELVGFLEIHPSELPVLIKIGLQAYQGPLGKPVRDLDSLQIDKLPEHDRFWLNKNSRKYDTFSLKRTLVALQKKGLLTGDIGNYYWIPFSSPVGPDNHVLRWNKEFLEFWFKSNEIRAFFEMLEKKNTDRKQPSTIKKTDGGSDADMSTMGRAGAKIRWEIHNELVDKALGVADNKWANGDDAYHNEMAKFLVGKEEFKILSKNALRKKLIPIADKYSRTRGKKGATKEKK